MVLSSIGSRKNGKVFDYMRKQLYWLWMGSNSSWDNKFCSWMRCSIFTLHTISNTSHRWGTNVKELWIKWSRQQVIGNKMLSGACGRKKSQTGHSLLIFLVQREVRSRTRNKNWPSGRAWCNFNIPLCLEEFFGVAERDRDPLKTRTD